MDIRVSSSSIESTTQITENRFTESLVTEGRFTESLVTEGRFTESQFSMQPAFCSINPDTVEMLRCNISTGINGGAIDVYIDYYRRAEVRQP